MRIASIEVENFKSLVDFRISLAKLSCLIGLNGAGKSTVLQFVDFMSHLVRGDITDWLEQRKWKSSDLKSKLTRKSNVKFCVRFSDEHDQPVGEWSASYRPSSNRCVQERFEIQNNWLQTNRSTFSILDSLDETERNHEIAFEYSGSILSALKPELLPKPILKLKQFLESVKSLDLLAPEHLRQRTRGSSVSLGLGGQNLATFIHQLSDQQRNRLQNQLKVVYPQLQSLNSRSLKSGWKQLEVSERCTHDSDTTSTLTTTSRHMNDGMLRLIAILAELQSDNQFLLFDEIENGINPEMIEFITDQLANTDQQVMVTTHSPMILNYLTDQVAKDGVIYLYKTREGHTRAIPFFCIPSLAEKLTLMGPGEAFVDTDLIHLGDEIERLTGVT